MGERRIVEQLDAGTARCRREQTAEAPERVDEQLNAGVSRIA